MALGSWLGQHNTCVNAPTCGTALVVEHNGDVYCCDHFVEPAYRLGNIIKRRLKPWWIPSCCDVLETTNLIACLNPAAGVRFFLPVTVNVLVTVPKNGGRRRLS